MEEEEFDWQIDQEMPVEDKPVGFSCGASMNAVVQFFFAKELLLGKRSSAYGFAEQHTAVFSKLQVRD